MNSKQSNRSTRIAALLCLIAFLMLTASANLHTCIADHHLRATTPGSAAITELPHEDNCVACDMLLKDTGRTLFTSKFISQTIQLIVTTVTPPKFVLISVTLVNDSSRSPPAI